MNTIVIYVIVEMISILFLHLAEKYKTTQKTDISKIKKSTIFLILSFIPLLFLIGFRDISVGVDTESYVQAFYRVINDTLTSADKKWLGYGYVFICKIVGTIFGDSYVFLNFVVGFLTLFFLYKTIWNNSEIPSLSLYILFSMCLYYQTFNQARQMLAIAILFYSIQYIKKEQFKKYVFFVLIATSIHESAIVFLPFYFISRIDIKKKYIFIYFIMAILGYVFFDKISLFISNTTYGKIYQKTDYYKEENSSILNLIVRIIMLVAALIFSKITLKKDENSKILYNLVIWCTIIQVLTTKLYILGRVTTYFYMPYILLIPNIINSISTEKKNRKIYIFIVVSIFAIYHYIYFKTTSVNSGYDNYKFFFS